MQIENFKLGIGLPLSWQYVPSEFMISFLVLNKPDYVLYREESGSIEQMRISIAERALKDGCTHLLFLDADMVYPPDTFSRLMAHDADVIGALCYRRWAPFEPLVFKHDGVGNTQMVPGEDFNFGDLIEVNGTGTGCLLFKTEVLLNLEKPWFEVTQEEREFSVHLTGEDINFCNKLKKAGYKILVDTSVEVDHLTLFRVNRNMYLIWKKLKEQGLLDREP